MKYAKIVLNSFYAKSFYIVVLVYLTCSASKSINKDKLIVCEGIRVIPNDRFTLVLGGSPDDGSAMLSISDNQFPEREVRIQMDKNGNVKQSLKFSESNYVLTRTNKAFSLVETRSDDNVIVDRASSDSTTRVISARNYTMKSGNLPDKSGIAFGQSISGLGIRRLSSGITLDGTAASILTDRESLHNIQSLVTIDGDQQIKFVDTINSQDIANMDISAFQGKNSRFHLASSQSSQAVGVLSGKDGVSMNFYDKDKLKEPNLSIVSNSRLKYKGLVIYNNNNKDVITLGHSAVTDSSYFVLLNESNDGRFQISNDGDRPNIKFISPKLNVDSFYGYKNSTGDLDLKFLNLK